MNGETILVADDDANVRTVIDGALTGSGYDVRTTASAQTLWEWVVDGEGDVVVTDVVMPDGDGLELLAQIREVRPELPIVVMSARSTLLTATKRGEFEYLPKPFDINQLINVINLSLEGWGRPAPIFRTMARVVGTDDLAVLISGESGTGKELVARALHDCGQRRSGPFVAVNMAAIPHELVVAELFGFERGAFAGAHRRTPGRFAQAHGGTLFLDEIGEMPLDAQTRLLRVLQQSEFTPLGASEPIATDVRIVAASNRDLSTLVRQARFREDLYYRLDVVPVRIPPLRERPEDIPDLVRHFLIEAAHQGLPAKTFDRAAVERLMAHAWPGNVRELQNLIRRMMALHSEDHIGLPAVVLALEEAGRGASGVEALDESLGTAVERHLSKYFAAHGGGLPPSGLYGRVLREIERPMIEMSLAATRGNQVQAARLLGLNRNTLRKKMRELGISGGSRGARRQPR